MKNDTEESNGKTIITKTIKKKIKEKNITNINNTNNVNVVVNYNIQQPPNNIQVPDYSQNNNINNLIRQNNVNDVQWAPQAPADYVKLVDNNAYLSQNNLYQ